ncbi:MAG: Arm DNA-binding domain-containing protein [Bacteroidota bacterium]
MLENSFGMFYYLKHSKNQKNGNKYVYLRITVNGERRDISIKRQWTEEQWNPQLGRAIGYNESAIELNSYLEIIAY